MLSFPLAKAARVLAAVQLTLTAALSHAAGPLPCQGRQTGPGTAQLSCAVDAPAANAPLRFSARFGGVHDDSSASVEASVDGVALPCDAGSVPRFAGEDSGETLVCRMSIAVPPGGAARQLLLRVNWHHAAPATAEVTAQ